MRRSPEQARAVEQQTAPTVRLVPDPVPTDDLVQSYRRLADVFHDVLSEQSLDALLERIADTVAELVPYDSLVIYEADDAQTVLTPVLARDKYAEEIMNSPSVFGQGITGWAVAHGEPVLTNQAHLDPRVAVIPGSPDDDPEALVSIPLIARDAVKGALNRVHRWREVLHLVVRCHEDAQGTGGPGGTGSL